MLNNNDLVIDGTLQSVIKTMNTLISDGNYSDGVNLGENMLDVYSYSASFLDLVGRFYFYNGQYSKSWEVYNLLLRHCKLTHEQSKFYYFNAHFNIPHILNNHIDYFPLITKETTASLITLSITTCKRLDLFKQTMNSFIRCCKDIHLISEFICVDDNSSVEDRNEMVSLYPFFNFVFKPHEYKGHAKSMNIILDMVKTPYLFHMEDDWQFFSPIYLQDCIQVLNSDDYIAQCLINKNYGETEEDVRLLGGIPTTTENGFRFFIHEYEPDNVKFVAKYGYGVNCAYWPHYSLRPGMNKTNALKSVGKYNPDANHFEMDFACRYVALGYKTAFLEHLYCSHIGRLTKDRNDETKLNAYKLNSESQFQKPTEENPTEEKKQIKITTHVINLDNRTDRWELFYKQTVSEPNIVFNRFPAINGYNLVSNRYLEQLFNPNDYNYRRGMIGCALSHIKLWTQLIETTNEVYLILEDDIELVPYFSQKLQHILSEGMDWDIIFLGHHIYKQYITDKTYNKFSLPVCEKLTVNKFLIESMGGTGGYIINKRGALGMLDFIQKRGMTNGIDTMMQKASDDLNIYWCTPHLIYSQCCSLDNMNVDTDIQKNYSSMSVSIEDRIRNELDFFNNNNISYYDDCKYNNINKDVDVHLCFNKCLDDDQLLHYKIGDVATVYSNIPLNYSLKYNNKYSTDHIIQY